MSQQTRDADPVSPREPDQNQQAQQGEQAQQSDPDAPIQPDPTLLAAQLAEANRERDQFRALAQRAQADLANYKRRAADDRQQALLNSKADILLKFLAVVDDFGRAIDMLPADANPAWREGISLVQRNLVSVMESEGVTKIQSAGAPFDPSLHEALAHQETPDIPDGAIALVTREGYLLNDRLLRPAQVIVAKAPADNPAPTDPAEQPNSQSHSQTQ